MSDLDADILEANERMGEALVEIGMALGLPKPVAGVRWGAVEILARAAQEHATANAARRYVEVRRSLEGGGPAVEAWRALHDVAAPHLS